LSGQILITGVRDGFTTIDKDVTKAREYFKKAADNKDADAMFELGRMVVKGLGEIEEEGDSPSSWINAKVKFQGLDTSWNGRTGFVLSYDEDSGRYAVSIQVDILSGKVVKKVREANLLRLELTDVERLAAGLEYIEKAATLGNVKAKDFIAKLLAVKQSSCGFYR